MPPCSSEDQSAQCEAQLLGQQLQGGSGADLTQSPVQLHMACITSLKLADPSVKPSLARSCYLPSPQGRLLCPKLPEEYLEDEDVTEHVWNYMRRFVLCQERAEAAARHFVDHWAMEDTLDHLARQDRVPQTQSAHAGSLDTSKMRVRITQYASLSLIHI